MLVKNWTMLVQNWNVFLNQLQIFFEDRIEQFLRSYFGSSHKNL